MVRRSDSLRRARSGSMEWPGVRVRQTWRSIRHALLHEAGVVEDPERGDVARRVAPDQQLERRLGALELIPLRLLEVDQLLQVARLIAAQIELDADLLQLRVRLAGRSVDLLLVAGPAPHLSLAMAGRR